MRERRKETQDLLRYLLAKVYVPVVSLGYNLVANPASVCVFNYSFKKWL